MNRKIKFRVWHIENKNWIDLYSVVFSKSGSVISVRDIKGESYNMHEIVLQQYTGFNDKNGKKIFEGDIVKGDVPLGTLSWRGQEEYMFKIEYTFLSDYSSDDYFQESGPGFNFYSNDPEELEIIGNIFESSELLDGEKKKMAHFGLDWKKHGKDAWPGKLLSLKQAANLLSAALQEDLDPENFLRICLKSSFGAYIQYARYGLSHSEHPSSLASISDVEHKISHSLEPYYLQPYEGLARLLKYNKGPDNDFENDFESDKTVEYLCNGGIIKINPKSPLLPIQLSVRDFIFDLPSIAEVKNRQVSREIKLEDLRFVEEELLEFVKNTEHSKIGVELSTCK